ncbi:MAG: conjugal transfer protein TraX [Eubacteriaceae bacterium]|nr:conjugal transfer protein TraX [Eubacteriaceae bacterium]
MTDYKKNDMLKIIAALAMVADHAGAVFFPDTIIFRMIGRIAFPIFAFQVAEGFSRTSNFGSYLKRMLIFAAATAIPFYFFAIILNIDPLYQNVMFTFSISLIVLYFLKNKHYILMFAALLFPLGLEALTGISFDYGIYGILVVLMFYVLKENTVRSMGLLVLTAGYLVSVYASEGIPLYLIFSNIQFLCIFALPLINKDYQHQISLPKYFFYVFYPGHIAGIVLLYELMH